MRNIIIGADPELFVKVRGVFVSAHDLIPGTKDIPYAVEGGAIQVDGVSAEFNINAASTSKEFANNIHTVRKALHHFVRESLGHDEFEIVASPTARFDLDYFNALPDDAKALGCQPDFNAYTGVENDPPATSEPFRTGSGHIHVGWGNGFDVFDEKHFRECRNIVQQLDCVFYPWSLMEDTDRTRRKLYGQMGSFRPKPYGVEYRPLSNFWTALSDFDLEDMYDMVREVVNAYFDGVKLYEDPFINDFMRILRMRGDNAIPQDVLHAFYEEVINTLETNIKLPKAA